MIALAFLLVSAQAVAPPPVIHAPAPPPMDPIYRRQGFSDEAIAILNTDVGGFFARIERSREAVAAVDARIADAIRADDADLGAIGRLMRERDGLAAVHKALLTERMLAIAAALPPADRKLYLRLHRPAVLHYRINREAPRPAPPPPPAPSL